MVLLAVSLEASVCGLPINEFVSNTLENGKCVDATNSKIFSISRKQGG